MNYAYFDGSLRPIQKKATIGFFILDEKGCLIEQYKECFNHFGRNSNLIEEIAFGKLLKHLVDRGYKKVIIRGDSKGLINKAKNTIKFSKWDVWYDLAQKFESIVIEWIPREKNYYADQLCTKAYK